MSDIVLDQELFNLPEWLGLLPEPAFVADENGILLIANQQFFEILQIEHKNISGLPLTMLFREEAVKKILSADCDKPVELISVLLLKGDSAPRVRCKAKRIRHHGEKSLYLVLIQPDQIVESPEDDLPGYQKLLGSIPFGMVLVDSRDYIIDINASFVKMFGYTADQIIGKHVNDFIVPPELYHEATNLSKEVLSGIQKGHETVRMDADGRRIHVAITAMPIQLSNGETLAFALYQDISDRKNIEAKLAEQEQELNRMVNWLPGMVYRCYFDENYTMIFVSDGALRVTGYEAQSFLKDTIYYNDLIYPECRQMVKEEWREGLEQNKIVDIQYRIIAADGSVRWVWERGRGLRNPQGELLFLEGYIEDMTELREAQDKIKMERDLLQALMDNMPDTIYFKDRESRFIRVNKAQAAVLGLNDSSLAIGFTDHDFFDQSHAGNAFKDEQRLMETGIPVINKQEHILTSEGWKWFSATKVPLRDPMGAITGLVGISRDITDVKQMEAVLLEKEAGLLKSNQEKDKLFSVIAHDLRSPFNSFLLLTEILAGEGYDYGPEELAKLASTLHHTAKGVAELLENLLSWAGIQRQTMKVTSEFFRLDEIVRKNLEHYQTQIAEKNIRIDLQLKDKLMLQSDPAMLSVVLRNIFSNAMKFTPQNGTVSVRTKLVDNGIAIEVEDSGIGMPAEMLKKLFDVQLKGRKGTAGEPSSGLGMILVKEFTQQLKGSIHVESEEGKGTLVRIQLPLILKSAV